MASYNVRLDEVLFDHRHKSKNSLKQLITSLIKELVEEAKPEIRPTHIPTHGENTARLNAVWNMAIARYKHNLLKELEEK